jgi:hypothetical protein
VATRLDSETARITAAVNGYTDRTVAANYALLKAAEFTHQNGYGHFAVASDQADASVTTTTYFDYYSGIASGFNVEKPRNDIVIRMFSGAKPKNAPMNVFGAVDVIETLGPQVLTSGDRNAGKLTAQSVSGELVTLLSYNDVYGLAMYVRADGRTDRSIVPPAFRASAARLNRGDRVPLEHLFGNTSG